MVGNTPCLGNGQIHREGSCDKRTTPMDSCTCQLARYGVYRRMEPSCRLHPMYKLQHAHTRPHGKLNALIAMHLLALSANKKTTTLKRCQDKTHRCVRSTTSHVQHEKQPLQAFALAVQPCADTSSRNMGQGLRERTMWSLVRVLQLVHWMQCA